MIDFFRKSSKSELYLRDFWPFEVPNDPQKMVIPVDRISDKSVRLNLDPFNEHTDEDVRRVLKEVLTICILIGQPVYKLVAESKGFIDPWIQGVTAPTVTVTPGFKGLWCILPSTCSGVPHLTIRL